MMLSFSWSLSAWNLFDRCKFAYKCRYVLKLPDPRPPGGPAQRGIDTHKTIEDNLLHSHPLTQELENKWGSAFKEIKNYPFQVEHKIALDRNWQPTNWLGGMMGEPPWLKMVLDLKVQKGQGYTVYDWKTGKEYPEHYDQKELYALGVMSEHPEVKSIKSVHVYLDLGKQTAREYHRDSLNARRTQWNSKAQKMEEFVKLGADHSGWIPEPNFLCRYCAYSKANGGPCKF